MNKYPERCSGCGEAFASVGAYMNHARYRKHCTVEMRFWGKVRKTDGCWLWTGALKHTKYGHFAISKEHGKTTNILAHRYSWALAHGPIKDGLHVLHKCDVRHCVRPDHLFLGTHQENMQDAYRKRRHTFGERCVRRKLSEENVKYILDQRGKRTARTLANEFGVSRKHVSRIWNGGFWKHLQPSTV